MYGILPPSSDLLLGSPRGSCFERIQWPSLPRKVEDFVGRLDTMREVLSYLGDRNCRCVVLLQCKKQYGRTSALTEIAHVLSKLGRKFAGRCAFFPGSAPGGLLIVDDAARSQQRNRARCGSISSRR